MDKLESMFDMQKESQEYRGFAFPMEGMTAAEYIKVQTLHCIDELCEMLHDIKGYKEWKVYDFNDTIDNFVKKSCAKGELVDALHFLLNIALALGITADELHAAYKAKNKINYQRLEDKEHYKKDTEVPDEDR